MIKCPHIQCLIRCLKFLTRQPRRWFWASTPTTRGLPLTSRCFTLEVRIRKDLYRTYEWDFLKPFNRFASVSCPLLRSWEVWDSSTSISWSGKDEHWTASLKNVSKAWYLVCSGQAELFQAAVASCRSFSWSSLTAPSKIPQHLDPTSKKWLFVSILGVAMCLAPSTRISRRRRSLAPVLSARVLVSPPLIATNPQLPSKLANIHAQDLLRLTKLRLCTRTTRGSHCR